MILSQAVAENVSGPSIVPWGAPLVGRFGEKCRKENRKDFSICKRTFDILEFFLFRKDPNTLNNSDQEQLCLMFCNLIKTPYNSTLSPSFSLVFIFLWLNKQKFEKHYM